MRLYRSPVRFCSQESSLEISTDRPFVRDLPLFGQAGGYTFKTAGIHRVWADHDVELLAGLPEGPFEGRANVVQFARMRQPADGSIDRGSQGSTVVPFRSPRNS